jgi:hypothetical protein
LRRTTSALTTTILGAALAASTVSAQQFLPSASARRGGSATSASESTPAPGSTSTANSEAGPGTSTDPIVGMAATRGARYLLRNGLDYINYQEYERALKYLREAETRQKELNNSEKLALKQAIERAQRGLREAVGSLAPYALSRRSRRSGGFSPARPDTQIAAAKPPASQLQGREALARTPSSEGSDQGQPIRLAGAEITNPMPAVSPASATPGPVPGAIPQTLPIAGDQPAQLSGMPKLPTTAGSLEFVAVDPAKIADAAPQPAPDTTALASTSPGGKPKVDAAAAAAQADLLSPLPPLTPVSEAQTGAKRSDLPEAAVSVAAVAATANHQPQTDATSADVNAAAPSLAVSAPTPTPSAADQPLPAAHELASLEPVQPTQSAQPGPASDAAAGKLPLTADASALSASNSQASKSVSEQPAAISAPISLEQPTDPGARPAPLPESRLIDPDSVPLPPLGSESNQPKNASPRPAQDTSPMPAEPAQVPASPAATASIPPMATTADDLPPLPQQTARESEPNRDDSKAKAPAAEPVPPAGEAAAPTVAVAPDDLPPLPQGAARDADPKTKTDPLPPAAEELPPLPPGVTGNPPASQEPTSRPAPAAETGPTQNAAPDSAAPPAAAAASPAVLESSQPAGAAEFRPSAEPTAPAAAPEPTAPVPAPAQVEAGFGQPRSAGAPLTAPAATGAAITRTTVPGSDSFIPRRENAPSTLRPDLQRRVEEMVHVQDEELSRKQARPAPGPQPADPGAPDTITDLRTQTQTQVDISRAPSPAEARPIRAIPVPEDWVPLVRRDWSAQRKYWAAAATCHMPLYFQDPMLERYGHSVEQYFGPLGRYMAYPVDDHTQTTQRNQMVQPFFSVGLFAWQIATWPYALVVDPPWEAQYDLGYWRPGDKIPTDLYYQPLTGTGPPLRGRSY